MIEATLQLECELCPAGHYRPPADATVEAMLLHMQVEHATDDVRLRLAAVCTCGASMTFRESRPTGGGWWDYFDCPACQETTRVKRVPEIS